MEEVVEALALPVTVADLVGFYKIASHRKYYPERLSSLIELARRSDLHPHHALLNLIELPEVAESFNLDLCRDFSLPVPLKMDFGAVVFGFAWDAFASDPVRRTGRWEPDVQNVMQELLKPGCVAIDVGGNIGCHAALMASLVGPTGAVHTFEPVQRNIQALRMMKRANGYGQLHIHPFAVSSEEAIVPISGHSMNSGGNFVGWDDGNADYVRAIALDSYLLPKLDRVDLIKIDIEGHEGQAIRGARNLIDRFRPNIIMEMCPGNLRARGSDPVDLLRSLTAVGLRIEIVGRDAWTHDPAQIVDFIEANSAFMDVVARRVE